MAYTPHTWQANELVTPEKLNAIEIGLGNTISNSGDNVISGSLKATGLRTIQGSNASSAQLLFNDKNDSQLAEILVSENAHQMFFNIYATDHQNGSSDGKYRQYYFETAPTNLSSREQWKILSTKNVIDNLTSTSTTDVLSAAMGKQLNDNKLNLSGGTLTGTLILGNNTLIFKNDDRRTGLILNSSGQFHIYSYPSDNTDANTTNREWYYLPAPTAGRTSQGQYSILTSKNLVTVDQGGTGADTAAAARTNLGITPANIGALALSGGTLTGGLTTNNLHVKGLVYFYINSSSNNTSYLRFSRDDTTSNISARIGVSATGQFSISAYPSDNTSQNDSAREFYYLKTPETNLTAQKNYLILTTRDLITVAQGGTGRSTFTSNKLLCGNGTGAIAELDAVGSSGQFLKSNGNAKPSWVTLTKDLIPSLPASKINEGTFATARIPDLTRSKITDIEFGETTIANGSETSQSYTINNKRGIVVISRSTSQAAIVHVAPSSQNYHIVGTLPSSSDTAKVTLTKTSSTGLKITNTLNDTIRVTWFLID